MTGLDEIEKSIAAGGASVTPKSAEKQRTPTFSIGALLSLSLKSGASPIDIRWVGRGKRISDRFLLCCRSKD